MSEANFSRDLLNKKNIWEEAIKKLKKEKFSKAHLVSHAPQVIKKLLVIQQLRLGRKISKLTGLEQECSILAEERENFEMIRNWDIIETLNLTWILKIEYLH